jgi:hypothetical protein
VIILHGTCFFYKICYFRSNVKSSGDSPQADELAKNNLQRIDEPNGLNQLGSSIRWKKLVLLAKNFGSQNLNELRNKAVFLEESFSA